MPQVDDRVGFIGLGAMGLPMARRLIEAGHELIVHNRSQEAVQQLQDVGAQSARSPADVASRSNVVLTMLPTEEAVVEVVLGEDGSVRHGTPAPQVLVDLSTVSPATVRLLADGLRPAGTAVVDAPVSGGVAGAVEGSLSVMVGGEQAIVDRVRPLLEVFGSAMFHVGPSGAGQIVKAANQVLVASIIQGLSEAIVLLDSAGTDTVEGLEAISRGLGANRLLDLKKAALLTRDFTPGGRAALHRKDLAIALAIGRDHEVFLPVTAVIEQLYTALAAQGFGDLDHTALLGLADLLAGGHR